jgi:hypothetical protein
MKDVVIPGAAIRREILVFAICVGLALVINAGAIVAYRTHWIELLTTWHVTLALVAVLYLAAAVLRLCWAGVRWLLRYATRRAARPA